MLCRLLNMTISCILQYVYAWKENKTDFCLHVYDFNWGQWSSAFSGNLQTMSTLIE